MPGRRPPVSPDELPEQQSSAQSRVGDTLLLADEPTGAVDTATGEQIGRLLLDLNEEGQTLVLVTHSPELADRYARRTVQLVDGRVMSDVTSGDL